MKKGRLKKTEKSKQSKTDRRLYGIESTDSSRSCFYDYGDFSKVGFTSSVSKNLPLTEIQKRALASILGE